MKYLIIEVTPDNLKCVGVVDTEADAIRKVARWNKLEEAWTTINGQSVDVQYKVLTVELADLINQLEK